MALIMLVAAGMVAYMCDGAGAWNKPLGAVGVGHAVYDAVHSRWLESTGPACPVQAQDHGVGVFGVLYVLDAGRCLAYPVQAQGHGGGVFGVRSGRDEERPNHSGGGGGRKGGGGGGAVMVA